MTLTTQRAIIIVGSIVALLTVLALAVPAMGRIVQSTSHGTHELPAGLVGLDLDSQLGDIRIRAAAQGEEPHADVTVRSGLTDPEVTSEVHADSAELISTCQRWWWVDNCSVDWDIVVPRDTELTIRNEVGEITVTEVIGPLWVTSGVGGLTAHDIGSPTVQASSSVGDITLELISPPQQVEATSSTGDVTVAVPNDGTGYRVLTDTSVGSVTNELGSDGEEDRVIDVSTSIGDITLRRG